MDREYSQEERDSVLRRVQKLLAIAQDDRANANEASAAAAQAEKLMRKFNIDHAETLVQRIRTNQEELETADVLATAKDNGTRIEKVPVWAGWLATAVGGAFDTYVKYAWVDTKKGRELAVRFHGFKSDVQVSAWMFDYLVSTVNRLCKEFRKDPAYLIGGRSVMNSYRMGMVQGILGNLHAMKREKEAEMQQAVASRALVVVKQQAIEERFGVFKYRSSDVNSKDVAAYARGREVGRKVDLNRRGIGGTSSDVKAIK